MIIHTFIKIKHLYYACQMSSLSIAYLWSQHDLSETQNNYNMTYSLTIPDHNVGQCM